ncbi:hypothetical protein Acy02nite_68280 [Actinoplanes cyaneus]|uniref:Uncharacterized protein n=1 Tax=Actinoplanes cyaneus TaxID=52696 RepID=A0A919M7M8_9ACTN|nr:hypothetical protein [Actinoplanes cyaneus]MCW2139120.1 hypothetical protein [Actinoplanes cyaneus]GID68947.1 hypothetical protein Acy02nite_68280 [Actinoplanes cyaneus]
MINLGEILTSLTGEPFVLVQFRAGKGEENLDATLTAGNGIESVEHAQNALMLALATLRKQSTEVDGITINATAEITEEAE